MSEPDDPAQTLAEAFETFHDACQEFIREFARSLQPLIDLLDSLGGGAPDTAVLPVTDPGNPCHVADTCVSSEHCAQYWSFCRNVPAANDG